MAILSLPHQLRSTHGYGDEVFPYRASLVGDRDARSEDRQLLLYAIMAATDTLVVVHSGADGLTGLRRPPVMPLGELLDALAPAKVVVQHPLQPFDARNFTAPFSFDRAELAGARAAAGPRAAPPPFLPAPLPRPEPGTVRLDDLVTFVEHPATGFLTQRVGLSP